MGDGGVRQLSAESPFDHIEFWKKVIHGRILRTHEEAANRRKKEEGYNPDCRVKATEP
jgi:hypothetical protein